MNWGRQGSLYKYYSGALNSFSFSETMLRVLTILLSVQPDLNQASQKSLTPGFMITRRTDQIVHLSRLGHRVSRNLVFDKVPKTRSHFQPLTIFDNSIFPIINQDASLKFLSKWKNFQKSSKISSKSDLTEKSRIHNSHKFYLSDLSPPHKLLKKPQTTESTPRTTTSTIVTASPTPSTILVTASTTPSTILFTASNNSQLKTELLTTPSYKEIYIYNSLSNYPNVLNPWISIFVI